MDTLKQSIILFDLDGTLTDSEEGIIRSTQYMQEKMGQRIWSAEELHFMVRAAADAVLYEGIRHGAGNGGKSRCHLPRTLCNDWAV